jgi:peptidoglycan-associated lipoprotein
MNSHSVPRAHRTASLSVIALFALAACGKKPTPAPEPVAAPPAAPAPAPQQAGTPAPAPTDDRAAREAAAAAEMERIRALLAAPVYFNYDQSELDTETRTTLDAKVPALRADPTLRLRIEGHADDRGSDEYNLALGMRRATAVRDYLKRQDIAESRLDVVSLGEERPTCQDAAESCWKLNRRAEFVIVRN